MTHLCAVYVHRKKFKEQRNEKKRFFFSNHFVSLKLRALSDSPTANTERNTSQIKKKTRRDRHEDRWEERKLN